MDYERIAGTECYIGITFDTDYCQATNFDNLPPEVQARIIYFLKICYLWLTMEMQTECLDMAGAQINIRGSDAACHLAWFHIQSEGLAYKNNRERIVEHLTELFTSETIGIAQAHIFLCIFYEGMLEDQYL